VRPQVGIRQGLSFLLALCLVLVSIRASLAQPTASSTQTGDLTNTQIMNQTGGTQTVIVLPPEPQRPFPIPGSSPLPYFLPIPPHFARPTTDGNFGNLMTLVDYKDSFTAANAEALKKRRGKVQVETTCSFPAPRPSSRIRILKSPQDLPAFKGRYQLIGFGMYKSRDNHTISEQVLGVAIQEGLKIGADAMILQEGAAMTQKSKGWSFGLFNSLSVVNAALPMTGAGVGNVSVGGLGFGRGRSYYVSRPWLRVQFFREIPDTMQPLGQKSPPRRQALQARGAPLRTPSAGGRP
jgi:hypothetical protein